VKIATWGGAQSADVVTGVIHREIERVILATGEGALTGDAFAIGDAVAAIASSTLPPKGAKGNVLELAYTLRVGGVGAAGLALFVRLLARGFGDHAVAAFSLRGSGHGEGKLDTATALAALATPPILAAPKALPFELASTGGPGVRVFLPSAKDHKAAMEKVFASWAVAASATVPGLIPARSGAFAVPRVKALAARLELEPAFAGVASPSSLQAAVPMLLGLLGHAKARGMPIERVEIGA
jgi:hypothetical protein